MFRFHLLIMLVLGSFLLLGCGPATPRSKLTGEWKGAPDVSAEVDQHVEQVKSQGGDEGQQALARGFGQTIGNFAARQALGVELDMQSDGSVTIGGRSQEALKVAPGQKGTWEVSDKEPLTLTLAFGDKVFEGKITFRDDDAFFFQFDAPIEAQTSLTGPAAPIEEGAKTKPATFLFRRKGALREM
jgi:hypothetical protein